MQNELITIGIPIYNMENSIKNAINSCLSQTYDNFEILIVNDGSKDNSMYVIKDNYDNELRSGKIRIYERPQNGGVCMAMRDLVEQAKGTYIAFLDADDTMMSTRIEKQYNAIKQAEIEHKNQMVASFCGSLVNNMNDKTQYNIDPNNLFVFNSKAEFGGGTGHSMYKVSDLKKMGNFNPEFSRSADTAMCLTMLINGCYYAMVNESLIQYNFVWNEHKEEILKKDGENFKKLFLKKYDLETIKKLENIYLNRYFDIGKISYVSLFGIKIVKILKKQSSSSCYLFGFLPIFKKKEKIKKKMIKYYLFGILPFWCKKIN